MRCDGTISGDLDSPLFLQYLTGSRLHFTGLARAQNIQGLPRVGIIRSHV